jgi:hypothetical protein
MTSNLTYCKLGAFGSAAICDKGDFFLKDEEIALIAN